MTTVLLHVLSQLPPFMGLGPWVYGKWDEDLSGWWFGTFFVFPYIGNHHPNWRTHMFQRGFSSTTNQLMFHRFKGDIFWTFDGSKLIPYLRYKRFLSALRWSLRSMFEEPSSVGVDGVGFHLAVRKGHSLDDIGRICRMFGNAGQSKTSFYPSWSAISPFSLPAFASHRHPIPMRKGEQTGDYFNGSHFGQ